MRCLTVFLAIAVIAVFAVGCDYTKKHHESLAAVVSPGISGHNVTINYMLLGTELTGVDVAYSTDGQFWFPATRGYGGDPGQGLTTSVTGDWHTWTWDSLADIGPVLSLNVIVRITPWGRGESFEGYSPVFIVNNTINTKPTGLILSSWAPATPQSGDILIVYGVGDTEGDAVTAKLQFSVDGGSNFFDARLVGTEFPLSVSKLDSSLPAEVNDGSDQLSSWHLSGLNLGVNTDAAGKIYVELTNPADRQISLYRDQYKNNLVAEGTLAGDGTVILAEEGSSGLSGSVILAFSGVDTDIVLTCFTTHRLVWDSTNDIGLNTQPDVRLRLEVIDGEYISTSPSYTPDLSPVQQLAIDNTGL